MKNFRKGHGQHTVTAAEMGRVLAKGTSHQERKAVMEDAVLWFLQQYAEPGVRYSNSDLCRAILANAAGGPAKMGLRRGLSFFVSSMARDPDFRGHIRLGREMKTTGGRRVRVREWVVDNNDGEAPTTREMKAIGEDAPDAKEVDKPDISRHPKPGYAPVTCACCGGTGRVYMKG